MNQETNLNTEIEPLTRGYHVLVDDNFHFMDESERYCAGVFASYEEALVLAKSIVDEFFNDPAHDPSRSAQELIESCQSFGDDPWIAAFGGAPEPLERFSAWTYAEEVANRMINRRRQQNPLQGGKP